MKKTVFLLLLGVVLCVTSQSYAALSNPDWSYNHEMPYDRSTDTLGSPFQRNFNFVYVASLGHSGGTAEQTFRGIQLFKTPQLIRDLHPGESVVSATFHAPLSYSSTSFAIAMPGVSASHVDLTQGISNNGAGIVDADHSSSVLTDLGMLVPATPGVASGGTYSIDVTAALAGAISSTDIWFPIRLQMAHATEPKTYDANVNMDYLFGHANGQNGGNPWIEYTVTPEPATMLLLGSGALALIRRRNRKA
jgi:hypothetical protein